MGKAKHWLLRMEKFCLKWNDFQVNMSKSINVFKQDKAFVDVTLVSDEGKHIQAHRVILSMASEFFNDSLKKMNHSSPMIFLPGFNAQILSSIVDYVYDGEVQLFQEDLDCFLDAAQKLKINGLLSSPVQDEINEDSVITNNSFKRENDDNEHVIRDNNSTISEKTATRTIYSRDKTVALTDSEDAKNAVNELILKCFDGWKCKECGKTCTTKSQIGLHVEIHIQGLSYSCKICNETYNNRMLLAQHKKRHQPKI